MNNAQKNRIALYNKFVNSIIPQFNGPKFFIKFLSKILPNYCVFEKSLFYKERLIVYIPKLCYLNPFFNSVMEYRLSSYKLDKS